MKTPRRWQHPFVQVTDPDITFHCGVHLAPSNDKYLHVEKKLGWKLPSQYRRFIKFYGAAAIVAKEAVWPRPEVGQVMPFWRAQYGFLVFGWDPEVPDDTNLLVQYEEFRQASSGGPDLLPFMQEVSAADYWCLDRKGKAFFWSHQEPDAPVPLKEDFDTLLVAQTRTLVEAKDKVKAERSGGRSARQPLGPPTGAEIVAYALIRAGHGQDVEMSLPMKASPELGRVTGRRTISRSELTAWAWEHARRHSLLQGTTIQVDPTLRLLLGSSEVPSDEVRLIELARLLERHLSERKGRGRK